jgi:CheY-like chemotaxis protein
MRYLDRMTTPPQKDLRIGFGARLHAFQNLQRRRIREILLVASAYDAFILEQDGQLNEVVLNEFLDLNLRHAPHIRRVSSAADALRLARSDERFDLIITMTRIGEMHVLDFARALRETGSKLPLALLTYDSRELNELITHHDTSDIDAIFIWQGDVRILLGIVKCIEDRLNADHDIRKGGVQAIVLIEDSVRFISAYLPMIYSELMKQAQSVLTEGISLGHKLLRMRARPKILVSRTFEDGWRDVERYRDNLLGAILDVEFPKDGERNSAAGLEFARQLKELSGDIPVLLQSTEKAHTPVAHALGASFLRKDSPHLLQGLRRFMRESFSFGEFVFRLPDGSIVGRAKDVWRLEELLVSVPEESVRYHAERNHFSNWLKARAEFALAQRLRPRQVEDFGTINELREDIIRSIRMYRRDVQRYHVADFNAETFDPEISFARLGGGSLGGKARGLAFVNVLLSRFDLRERYPGILIEVPPSLVIGTDVFDEFLDANEGLHEMALGEASDKEITERFLAAEMPEHVLTALRAFVERMREPLAVRSSSLLEDSQFRPLAGVYDTIMIPNADEDPEVRLQELREAILRVYASTFSGRAKGYFAATPFRLEEEKMAVILQRITGRMHGDRYYPDFSGEVRSHNHYPIHPARSEDGMASIALGLGRMVVEDGSGLRFCPRYPRHLVQFSSTNDMLANAQKTFYALDMGAEGDAMGKVREYDLAASREDGTLGLVASVWSPDNDTVYDGLAREGVPIVTFASILKHGLIPLPTILELLLVMGRWGMTSPVEFEFAFRRGATSRDESTFSVLQLRPLVPVADVSPGRLEEVESARTIVRSTVVMGSGWFDDIQDVVYVRPDAFERSRTVEAAQQVAELNAQLRAAGTSCLLVGMGRWGSADPWLGIPVTWDMISSARVIVETCFQDLEVTPSQGTHFFQNLTAFEVGYLTVHPTVGEGEVDWAWLDEQPAVHEKPLVRHVRLERPLRILIDSGRSLGVVCLGESDEAGLPA